MYRIQDLLKGKLIVKDDFTWTIPSKLSSTSEINKAENLRYIGGVDISFSRENASLACAALIVVDAYSFEVVYEDFDIVELDVPYFPGFLAFREVCFRISHVFCALIVFFLEFVVFQCCTEASK